MITFKIDNADVILSDLGEGQGKIIIADTSWGYNFSNYWGAMGMPLPDFLKKINADYFADKLGPHAEGEVNTKKTVKAIRRSLKEYFYNEYPWYKHMEFQQSLRDCLKKLEEDEILNVDHYMHSINNLVDYDLDYYLIKDEYDRKNIKDIMKSAVFSEPWYHLVYDEHRQITYLKKFHKKLVKELKKKKIKTTNIEQYENN